VRVKKRKGEEKVGQIWPNLAKGDWDIISEIQSRCAGFPTSFRIN
jgi:hypothetical protein